MSKQNVNHKLKTLSEELARMAKPKPVTHEVAPTSSYTPGPWKVGNGGMIYTTDLMTAIASTFGHENNSLDEQRANAALCAAAPELLEALRQVLIEQDTDLSCELAEQIQEAIAKAEGR